ncbi:MAG: hypothetical protein ACPGJS_19275 [Flammeovirgaceae bacterium]
MKTVNKFLSLIILGSCFLFTACDDDATNSTLGPVASGFLGTSSSTDEDGSAVSISVGFEAGAPEAGTVIIDISETGATSANYTTSPAASGGQITLAIAEGQNSASFIVTPVDDNDADGNKTLTFTLSSVSGGIRLGNTTLSHTLTITEDDLIFEQVAFTSFEEPNTGGKYIDTFDPNTDHDLINNPGQADVDFISVGGEMGFDASYVNTQNSTGLQDDFGSGPTGDFVGVTDFTGDVGSFTDGTNGYQFQDTDGQMILTFDDADFTNYLTGTVSLDVFFSDTGFESGDAVRIYIKVGSQEIDLVNLQAGAIADVNNQWLSYEATFTGGSNVTLIAEVETNSTSEEVYLDNVKFIGGRLP